MKRLGFAEFKLVLGKDVTVAFEQRIEVSLDCTSCRRRCRTVVFPGLHVPGRCDPRRHPFGGQLVQFQAVEHGARYEFEYSYSPFVDEKYPDEKRYGGHERGAPSWVRAYFETTCPSCGNSRTGGTQTNIVRPWTCVCTCGVPLYTDTVPPTLGWVARPRTAGPR